MIIGNHYIRWISKSKKDISAIMDIDDTIFGPKSYTREQYEMLLSRQSVLGLACEEKQLLMGFVVYEYMKKSIYIIKFGVDPLYREAGIGTALINRVKCSLNDELSTLEISVPDNQLVSHLFLKKQGFLAKKVLRIDGQADHYLFEYDRKY